MTTIALVMMLGSIALCAWNIGQNLKTMRRIDAHRDETKKLRDEAALLREDARARLESARLHHEQGYNLLMDAQMLHDDTSRMIAASKSDQRKELPS